ncbi:MAG: MogA/MoaB family molybdenum cofactor biosynthesis protein [Chloroflexi bacterium]|nr:MogA/MoaB family molybdenum cofactor biosynthesis protein [Chloroflexota bacterium]
MSYTVGVLTASDKGYQGQREDLSGPAIRQRVEGAGGRVARFLVLPDDLELIAQTLAAWADAGDLDVIITTGGTGLSPRDVTPEATRQVAQREIPGIAEALRVEGLKHTPMAMLSRGVAGVRGRTLIVNLPGSPRAVAESMEALLPVLPHAVETLREPVEAHPAAG